MNKTKIDLIKWTEHEWQIVFQLANEEHWGDVSDFHRRNKQK